MRRQQNEGRIRELWMELPEKHREGILDVIIFKHDLARNRPDLLTTFDGDPLSYLKEVLSGLYRRT
jgi:hypothetical protein